MDLKTKHQKSDALNAAKTKQTAGENEESPAYGPVLEVEDLRRVEIRVHRA
jgi:hypothetical protein